MAFYFYDDSEYKVVADITSAYNSKIIETAMTNKNSHQRRVAWLRLMGLIETWDMKL